jgi:hypothetical protein
MVNEKLTKKKGSWPKLAKCTGICLEGLNKTMNLRQNGWSPSRDLICDLPDTKQQEWESYVQRSGD